MGRVRASGAVSKVDIELFALAVSDMRFLFDEDLEQFVSDIHDALLKKHALDALLEKAVGQADQALMDKALRKSRRAGLPLSQHPHGNHLFGSWRAGDGLLVRVTFDPSACRRKRVGAR